MAWHTASNRASARNVAKLEMLFITPLPSPLPQGEREFILKATALCTPYPLVGEGWGEGVAK